MDNDLKCFLESPFQRLPKCAERAPLIYLASPYSGNVEENMHYYLQIDAELLSRGFVTISPLSKHFCLAHNKELGSDWFFWQNYSYRLLSVSDVMIVIKGKGWDVSTGVQAEIIAATKIGIPVLYLDPDEFLLG